MKFWKMSGAGNDFVLIQGTGTPALARRLCDRKGGVGADGLLALRGKAVVNFNPDGSKAFCGNGSRCVAVFLSAKLGRRFSFIANGKKLKAVITGKNRARILMPRPGPISKKGPVYLVNTGVPHAVVVVKGLDRFPVVAKGRALRRKLGANVNFVERKGTRLYVRTYERGVEDETLACGTGVVASALALGVKKIVVRSGETLTVTPGAETWLEGPARLVFQGEIK
jgi:diaminopimelate epimerase